MFNLKQRSKYSFRNDLLKNVLFVCSNLNEAHQLAINKDNVILKIEEKKIEHYFTVDNEYKIENLVGFNHIPDINSLCLFYEDGLVLQISTEDLSLTKVSLTLKIKNVSFSPESDRILIVNEKLQLITFDCMFNIANVSDLHDENEGEVDHLDVGWGKKETQFHGSEGKSSRTVKEVIGKHLDYDDLKPIFTWKNDGSFFASSVVDPKKECRKIRIYNREGFLQYQGEEKPGLENTLTWKPDTELLTTSIVDNTGHYVVFYEKNGLKFFDFPLPYKKGEFKIKDFVWSTVSNCLAIFGHETVENENYEKQVVLLYTMSNYHWYLKQKLNFYNTNDEKNLIKKVINIDVNTNEFVPIILNIYFNDGSIREYVYIYQIDSNYDGTVAVIDGKKLLITPYQYCSIPPPMYGYSIIFNNEITDVSFSKPSSKQLFVKLNNQKVFLLKESENTKDDSDFKIDIKQKFTIPLYYSLKLNCYQDIKFEDFYQYNLRDDGRCFAISANSQNESSLLIIDLISTSPSSLIILVEDKSFDTLSLIEHDINKKYLLVIEKNGLVWKIDPLENEAKLEELFLYQNSNKYHLKLIYKSEVLVKVMAFDLNMILSFFTSCSLYLNNYALQKINCNSMMVHDSKFLIYTTNKQKLRFIWLEQLRNLLDTLSVLKQNDKSNTYDQLLDDQTFDEKYRNLEMCSRYFENETNLITNSVLPIDRSVEVGSRIVCTCLDNNKLVLTLPRGNVEIITPRILVLDRIKLLLNTLQYHEAFQMMKKNRINLNLIYDHDPTCFLINAKSFVDQIASKDTTDLCLFLSELSQEDVSKTMYFKYDCDFFTKNTDSNSLFGDSFLNFPKSNLSTGNKDCIDGKICLLQNSENLLKETDMDTKLDLISVKIRTILNSLEKKKYFIPKLLTYLKQSKPSIQIALIEMSEEKDQDLKLNALNHLKYIIDINILIKEALGTYDLEIARMVYNISNDDPKEYLALLSNFEKMDNLPYRRYQIDLHLKRYDLAIKNLSKCTPFDKYASEAFELIKNKNIYKESIRAFKKNQKLNEYLKKIWVLYGDYLLAKKYFNESLYAYKQGENYINAIKAAQLSDNWQEVITCAHLCAKQQSQIELPKNQQPICLSKIYKTTADNLSSKGEANYASFIYGYHLNDWNQAIKCLITNHCWQDVFRLLSIAELGDLKCLDILKKENTSIKDNLPQKIKLDENQYKQLQTLAKTTLLKHAEEIVEFLIESDNELKSYTERLSNYRQKQVISIQTSKLTSSFSFESEEFIDDQSTVSSFNSNYDSSEKRSRSNQSQTNSLSTNKSSRKKKKDERNKYRLKEGSKNEDLGLIYNIKQRIKSIEKIKPTIKNLIFTLETQNFNDSARQMQYLYEKILDLVEFVINYVWSESFKNIDEYESIKIEKITDVNQIRDFRLRKPPKFTKTESKILTLN